MAEDSRARALPLIDEFTASTPLDSADLGSGLRSVYESHRRTLIATARFLLDDPSEAEEVVQDAFGRALDAAQRGRVIDDPLGYVRASVVNGARSRLRSRMRRRRVELPPPDDSASAETEVVRDDERRRVHDAIRTLPRRQRECVVLRHLMGLSVDETAATIGISSGTVKAHTHRAMQALATQLEDR